MTYSQSGVDIAKEDKAIEALAGMVSFQRVGFGAPMGRIGHFAGLVDFSVANAGPSAHEFLIFRADQAPDALPTGSDGRVDESSNQITKVFDSGDNIAANGSKVFHAALTPGKYVMVCNLPGHYKAGMHEAFTVH